MSLPENGDWVMETLEASVSLNFPHRQTPAYLSMHSLTTAKFPSPIVLPTLYRSVIVAGIWKPSSDSSERIISVFLLIEKEAQTTKDTFLRITHRLESIQKHCGQPPPLQAHIDSTVFNQGKWLIKKNTYWAHLDLYHCHLCFLLQQGFRGGNSAFWTSC